MTIYWLILVLPLLLGLSPVRIDHNFKKIIFWLFGILLVILIGWRHEIGGDWFRYIGSAYGIQKGGSFDFLSIHTGDYGYRFIHWVSVNYLNGIYSTNLISAIFFVAGLIRFSKSMPIPWMALFVSVQFLVVVVSMGYTRQSIAIGFIMWGLVDLVNEKKLRFYVLVIIGSFFHLTSLVMLPVGALYRVQNKKLFFILYSIFLLVVVGVLFADQIERLIHYYIVIKYHHSDGAVIRVFFSFIAAIIFFIYREKFKKNYNDEKLWFIFSLISIILFPASFYYSTFVDRIAIYFIPLQLVIFSRVPILIESPYNRTIFVFGTIFAYSSALFTWLYFGNFSRFWLPYQNLLTV